MKKTLKGSYSSIHDFIEQNKLEKEAQKVFGKNWEADNDIEQVQKLANHVSAGYVVNHIKMKTKRDFRTDNYIQVK